MTGRTRSRARLTMNSHREFELFVSRVEGALSPVGATVKSPDYILDAVTGEPREVDAAIPYDADGAPVLITLECRERSRVQDVTWIEQLVTNRAHIKADRTIAISSSGFPEPALRAAAYHGISARI